VIGRNSLDYLLNNLSANHILHNFKNITILKIVPFINIFNIFLLVVKPFAAIWLIVPGVISTLGKTLFKHSENQSSFLVPGKSIASLENENLTATSRGECNQTKVIGGGPNGKSDGNAQSISKNHCSFQLELQEAGFRQPFTNGSLRANGDEDHPGYYID
jgi:hypothetical protein